MKIDDISTWEAFERVAKFSNFTRAAESLNITPSQLSKRIAKLEHALEVRLFQRSTRVVRLTDEGLSILPKVEAMLQDLDNIEGQFSAKECLTGTIKVTCVDFVADVLLSPVLKRIATSFPSLVVEVEVTKKFVNLIEEGFDMALRIETPKDSDLVYRKLASNDLVFCASPDYLKKSPSIKTPEDLKNHRLLMLGIHRRCQIANSSFKLGDFEASQRVLSSNGVFLTDLALQGQGILVRSVWAIKENLENGSLVQLLPEHPLPSFGQIYAVIPSKRYLTARVRTVLDMVVEQAQNLNLS